MNTLTPPLKYSVSPLAVTIDPVGCPIWVNTCARGVPTAGNAIDWPGPGPTWAPGVWIKTDLGKTTCAGTTTWPGKTNGFGTNVVPGTKTCGLCTTIPPKGCVTTACGKNPAPGTMTGDWTVGNANG